jgi:hypothetical protein
MSNRVIFYAVFSQGLTETIFVLERPVEFHYPGVAGSQFDEGILFDESRLKFIVSGEVALVEHLYRIFVFGDSMSGLHNLQSPRLNHAGSTGSALRTVE